MPIASDTPEGEAAQDRGEGDGAGDRDRDRDRDRAREDEEEMRCEAGGRQHRRRRLIDLQSDAEMSGDDEEMAEEGQDGHWNVQQEVSSGEVAGQPVGSQVQDSAGQQLGE